MSSNLKGANAGKIRRMISRKSHSWWWDSHISPKNSKWLAENFQEMDIRVKEMLRLIEEEGDSFAKKAEMYYQKRPELIAHVEDFYRMYRALAERYDNVTGELRKNIQSELKSQGSGSGSDFGSEPPSPSLPSFDRTPDSKPSIPKPNHRAAGFEFFLGSGGSSDRSRKESDHSSSSSSDFDSESDDSKDLSGDGDEISSGLHRRILQLENELCVLKAKLSEHESCGESVDANADLSSKIPALDNDKREGLVNVQTELSLKISVLENDLLAANEKLQVSEAEIRSLQQKLEEKNLSSEAMGEELSNAHVVISKLETRVVELESEVRDNKQEIEKLKGEISSNNQTVEQYKAQLADASEKFLQEKYHLEADIGKLDGVIKELKEDTESKCKLITELNLSVSSFTEEVSTLLSEKDTLVDDIVSRDGQLNQLHLEHAKLTKGIDEAKRVGEKLKERVEELEDEVEKQRVVISDGAEGKREAIRQLCFSLEHYRDGYHRLRQVLHGHGKRPRALMAV